MGEIIEEVRLWIESVIAMLGYPGLTIVMALETLFPPIPSSLVLPLAGFMVYEGRLSFVGVVVAGTLGAVIGSVGLYYIGRWGDERLVRRFIRRYGRYMRVTENELDKTLNFFHRYGALAILIGPLIPMLRSLVLIPAGMRGLPLPKVVLYVSFSATIYNVVLIYIGMLLGQNWQVLLEYINQYQNLTLIAMVIVVALFIVRVYLRRRLRQGGEER
jgi:membrane protein DedA with SNARE-associated domain